MTKTISIYKCSINNPFLFVTSYFEDKHFEKFSFVIGDGPKSLFVCETCMEM